jgi:LETM1 and EF-hand domain-containing protein 1
VLRSKISPTFQQHGRFAKPYCLDMLLINRASPAFLYNSVRSPLSTLPRELRVLRDADATPFRTKEVVDKETITHKATQFAKEEAAMHERVAPSTTKKKPLLTTVKDGLIHYWDGTKLLGLEIKISTKLLYSLLKGEKLTRRERRQVPTACDFNS